MMSDRTRYKGKFIKRKQLERINDCRKRFKKSNEEINCSHGNADTTKEYPCVGSRIVDIHHLAKNLFCYNCKKPIHLINVEKEKIVTMRSVFSIRCSECDHITLVETGKTHWVNNTLLKTKHTKPIIHDDTTTKTVLGVLHSGTGVTELNKILACWNAPGISAALYKRYEREVGPAIEQAAKQSCKRAAEEERRLVLTKSKEIAEELPEDIALEICKEMQSFNDIVDNDNNAVINERQFNRAIGNMVNIVVSYDMGWSKRGNGRSYDSLNGYGVIIGFLNGKVLDYRTRNRMCRKCNLGHPKDDHDCRKNHVGSAKIMEAEAGEELVNRSDILKEAQLNVIAVIGDDDSTTIKHIREKRSGKIYKLSDRNHLKKNFKKQLYSLQKTFKELKKKTVIPHIMKCFNYAVSQNKRKPAELTSILKSIPDHLFNLHENCASWCNKTDLKHKVVLEDQNLWEQLKKQFNLYAENAEKISVAASTQGNEALNNTFSRKAPKNKCFSTSESTDYRIASGILVKNEGEVSLLNVKKNLNLSPGRHTYCYAINADKIKRKVIARSKLIQTKCRRNILNQEREQLRISKEKGEGTQYKSGCGLLSNEKNREALNRSELDSFESSLNVQSYPWSKDFRIIYFDMETSSLRGDADILQIAAKSGDSIFETYIQPTQPIDRGATKVTGLKNVDGNLFLHGKHVETISLEEAIISFYEFLDKCNKPCLLVAHNAKFDVPRLLRGIEKTDMLEQFNNIIYGFSDSLTMFKKILIGRKGAGMFKLCNLAKDLLKIDKQFDEKFHEALYDVTVLEALSSIFLPITIFKQNVKTLRDSYILLKQSQTKIELRPLLKPLQGVVSNGVLDKMAAKEITFKFLQKLFEKGVQFLVNYLSEKVNEKPRITANKRVLNNIVKYFSNENRGTNK